MILVLLQKNAAVNALTNDGDHALHLLLANVPSTSELQRQKYSDCLVALQKRQANLSAQNALGNTPLHTAAIQGNEIGAKWLLSSAQDAKALCNIQNGKGETALHFAVASKRHTIVRSLMQYGASATVAAGSNSTLAPSQSPLAYAQMHCTDMVGLLQGRSRTRNINCDARVVLRLVVLRLILACAVDCRKNIRQNWRSPYTREFTRRSRRRGRRRVRRVLCSKSPKSCMAQIQITSNEFVMLSYCIADCDCDGLVCWLRLTEKELLSLKQHDIGTKIFIYLYATSR
jgi:hypothetical protein